MIYNWSSVGKSNKVVVILPMAIRSQIADLKKSTGGNETYIGPVRRGTVEVVNIFLKHTTPL